MFRPVDSEATPLVAVVSRVEAEVENEVTRVLVVLNPVEVMVEREPSWLTLTASVPAAPAARLLILKPPTDVFAPVINKPFEMEIVVVPAIAA